MWPVSILTVNPFATLESAQLQRWLSRNFIDLKATRQHYNMKYEGKIVCLGFMGPVV